MTARSQRFYYCKRNNNNTVTHSSIMSFLQLQLLLLLSLVMSRASKASAFNNHWVLKDSKILQKLDSPFHMREPDNLVAFLAQIRYNDYVERSYMELLSKREQIVDHLRLSMRYGEELIDQAKCSQQMPNFIDCLDNLTKKTSKMYNYVEYMKNEVREFKKLKHKLTQSHERLIQQQLPLGARFLRDSNVPKEELHRRGQYCSSRTPVGAKEPVLFCDFYSDMQMHLESKDVDIDIDELERDLKANTDAVIRQVSTEIRKQMNMQQIKAAAAAAAATKMQHVLPAATMENTNEKKTN